MVKQGTLLVVDDNKNILTSLQYLLSGFFTRVITSSTPVTIPTLLQQEKPELRPAPRACELQQTIGA